MGHTVGEAAAYWVVRVGTSARQLPAVCTTHSSQDVVFGLQRIAWLHCIAWEVKHAIGASPTGLFNQPCAGNARSQSAVNSTWMERSALFRTQVCSLQQEP